jgi:hypothetical protein
MRARRADFRLQEFLSPFGLKSSTCLNKKYFIEKNIKNAE